MSNIMRREFLGLAGIGTAGLAIFTMSGCNAGQPKDQGAKGGSDTVTGWTEIDFNEEVDICILGAGASGLACAYKTAEAGLSTLVVEKQATYGGDAAPSANTWMAGYSDICKEERPDQYTPLEQVYESYDKLFADDPDYCKLFKNWITHAAAWHRLITKELGVTWQQAIPCAYNGVYWPQEGIGQGKELWNTVYTAIQNAGARFLYSMRGDAFIVDEQNKVVGLRCWDGTNAQWIDIKARAIALCAGGFASNQAMIAQYYPDMLNRGCITTASMGEGIKLGQSIGITLSHMGGQVNYNPHSECIHVSQAIGRSISLLDNGKRFYDETAIHNGPEFCLKAGAYSWWVIWDRDINEGPSSKQVESSKSIRVTGDSIQELAGAMKMPEAVLKEAFENWDRICDSGLDSDFSRTKFLEKLEPPYYALKLFPVRYKTSGGLLTSEFGEALDESHSAIPGIYAAGQTGGTSDIMPACGSGMMIGEKIAEYLKPNALEKS